MTTRDPDVVPWEELDRVDRPVVLADGRCTSAAEAGESRSGCAPQYGAAAPAKTSVRPKSASAVLAVVSIPRLAAVIVPLLLVAGCAGAFALGWNQGARRWVDDMVAPGERAEGPLPAPLSTSDGATPAFGSDSESKKSADKGGGGS